MPNSATPNLQRQGYPARYRNFWGYHFTQHSTFILVRSSINSNGVEDV
ncbi:hypothetical protein AZE42_03020 [Rhizopogon vesiculosus]|uniref:Uncharacterized protein n=1 Tax=Rhizopogon vesiculosus TaxID=180088 RepID=A0A1J8Q7P2_9AGAM|nr:hypothetical protein AZE42_03020 [Rhizopogon vesiculosus]